MANDEAPTNGTDEEVETSDSEKYVTKSELRDTLKEILDDLLGQRDDDGDEDEGDDDLPETLTIKDVERIVEERVAKISEGLKKAQASKPRSTPVAKKVETPKPEEKPASPDALPVLDRLREKLWGAR